MSSTSARKVEREAAAWSQRGLLKMSREAENPLQGSFWRTFSAPRPNRRAAWRHEMTLEAFMDGSACGKSATPDADEVVVPQPQRAAQDRYQFSLPHGKSLLTQQLTDGASDCLKMAGRLLSSEWLSQPPSERS